jgi:hypothetical protein
LFFMPGALPRGGRDALQTACSDEPVGTARRIVRVHAFGIVPHAEQTAQNADLRTELDTPFTRIVH